MIRDFAALAALIAAAVSAAFAAASPPAAGATAPSDFAWVQPIGDVLEPRRLYRVLVPGAVFDGCAGRPDRDLRVIDASGRALPYFVFVSPAGPPVRARVRPPADPGHPAAPAGLDGGESLATDRRPVPMIPVEWSECEGPEACLQPGWQTVVFDTGGRNRPVELLSIAASGEYSRPVAVFTRNDTTGRWERAGSGQVRQTASNRQDRVELAARGRYWRIDIRRGDDAPLGDLRVSAAARPRWIVFESRDADRANLVYGADGVLPPSYDLARRTADRDILSAPKLSLGAREANPLHRPREPGSRIRRSLVTAGVVAAGLAVLVVILRMLRETAGPEPG